MVEKEYIEREKALKLIRALGDPNYELKHDDWNSAIYEAVEGIAALATADVRPERHGHVVWKERHSGGFRTAKCLATPCQCINTPACNRIARIDDRLVESRPYCSECGKLLGVYLSFCGNCGAKMDGKDGEDNETKS